MTSNDPLGALEQPILSPVPPPPPPEDTPATSPPNNLSDDPILFRSSVHRSATFEGSPPSQSKIHR